MVTVCDKLSKMSLENVSDFMFSGDSSRKMFSISNDEK